LLAALATVLSACQINVDWAQWGNGVERIGESGAESTLGTGNVSQLQHLWSVNLGSQINSAPILASGLDVNGTTKDVIYVGSEHGVLFAVTTEGQIIWYRYLGANTRPDCMSTIDGVHGVSASAVFDRARNRVYAADGNGKVWALNPTTGAVVPGWPITYSADGLHDIVESAPTLIGNHLYVETASYCDVGPYRGRVLDINPDTNAIAHTWFVNLTLSQGGSVWGWGGASVDAANGDVYVATGNAITPPENQPYADSVVRLSSDLTVKAFHSPAPMIADDDFGTTPTLFRKSGCPPQLVVEQKNGSLYLYDRDAITTGYRQRIQFGQPDLIGVAAYSTRSKMIYVVNGKGSADGTYIPGLAAFNLDADCKLALAWQTPASVSIGTTPTVANGVVYYAGGFRGTIHALDAVNGTELWNSGTTITGAVLAAPIVVNGRLYAAGYDNYLHAWGL
jgi:outer membrane protein assembly factor BamB